MLLLEKAMQYAEDVVNGIEPTTWEVKKQCEIFLDDYNTRQHDDDFEYYFDKEKLNIINNILSLFNFATGFVVGENVLTTMANFQAFFIANIFGWRFKVDCDKFRYRDVVLFIPRKSGKTMIVALVLLLLMLTEQNYSEFYSICLDRSLAAEVKKAMQQLLEASPHIAKRFSKIPKALNGKIECTLTKSFYQPRTAEADRNNSIRPSAVICDEVGAFVSNDNIQAMRSGQLSVKNPLMMKITTAYENSESVMLDELEYDRMVLNGVEDNKRLFCLLYYCDKEEAWTDEGLYKANPLRVKENYDEIKENRARALRIPSEQGDFMTKHLNIFLETNEGSEYVKREVWDKYSTDKVDFTGKDVVVGWDLSLTTDLTAVVMMYKEDDKYYVKAIGFLPDGSLMGRREKFDYKASARRGECILCNGDTVSHTQVENYIRSIESMFDCRVRTIVGDPSYANSMIESLGEDYDVIPIKQYYNQLSSPTKEFRNAIYAGNIIHEESKLYDWCVMNATTCKDRFEREILDKSDKNRGRIDLLAATIFAFAEASKIEDDWAIQVI